MAPHSLKLELILDADINKEGDLEVSDINAVVGDFQTGREYVCLDGMTGPDGAIKELMTSGAFGRKLMQRLEKTKEMERAEATIY